MKFNQRVLPVIVSLLSLSLLILIPGYTTGVHADVSDNIEEAYHDGILSGKINPTSYSKSAFQYTYQEGLKIYTQQLQDGTVAGSYLDWLKEANYGAMPDGSGTNPDTPKIEDRSAAVNVNRFVRDIRKGDILIVKSGGFGHAAIATTNNYILEMHGGGNIINWAVTGIPNNNRQYATRTWINNHIKNWTEIWRPRQGVGSSAANYADYKFWSSTHGLKKNRHITYGLGAGPRTTDPNYCSKMVWQSFWFGTGSKNVATGTPAFITPNALPTYFYKSYAPYKVGSY